MAEVDFVPVGTGAGANVLSQAAYLASPLLSPGQQPGIASSAFNNKAIRQATYMVACLAQYLSTQTGNPVLDDGNTAEVIATMQQAWSGFVPSGATIMFGGTVAPTGYLLCQGQAVSRATYATLFAAIGTAYGVGDGATTFNVPDMRGLVPRGVTGASANDPDAAARTAVNGGNSGNNVGSFQSDQVGPHVHNVPEYNSGTYAQQGAYGGTPSTPPSSGALQTYSNGTTETRMKNLYFNFIIKT